MLNDYQPISAGAVTRLFYKTFGWVSGLNSDSALSSKEAATVES